MIRIREISKTLIGTFIQWIGMRKGSEGSEEVEVRALTNFTSHPIIIKTPEGELRIFPSGVIVSVDQEEEKYVVKVRGKRLDISRATPEIKGLDYLLEMPEGVMGIVEPRVFEEIVKNPALYERLRRRVATYNYCEGRKEGWLVVRTYDLEVL